MSRWSSLNADRGYRLQRAAAKSGLDLQRAAVIGDRLAAIAVQRLLKSDSLREGTLPPFSVVSRSTSGCVGPFLKSEVA
jgi:hypothetical protein